MSCVQKPEPPAGDAPPSEPALTTEAYPWIAMASTLEACFDNADPSQPTANSAEDPVATPPGDETLSQQAVKPDAEPTVQPSDAAGNASEVGASLQCDLKQRCSLLKHQQFSKAAPEIMKSFHAHGDACNKAETDSLKLATREQPNADVEQPLQDYYDMLAHLGNTSSLGIVHSTTSDIRPYRKPPKRGYVPRSFYHEADLGIQGIRV